MQDIDTLTTASDTQMDSQPGHIINDICCCCGMNEDILNFELSPLCIEHMKFLVQSVVKLGCKRCISWKRYVKTLLLSVKISCVHCLCPSMKVLIPSAIKLGCKRYMIGDGK